MAKGKPFGGKQGSNWKKSGMTQKRYDALEKAHKAAALLRKGSGKGTVTTKRKAVSVSGVTKSTRSAAKGSYKMFSVNTKSQMPKLKSSTKMKELSAKYKSLTKLKASMKKSGASSKDVRNVTKRINRVINNMNKAK